MHGEYRSVDLWLAMDTILAFLRLILVKIYV